MLLRCFNSRADALALDSRSVFALDPKTQQQLWRYDLDSPLASVYVVEPPSPIYTRECAANSA